MNLNEVASDDSIDEILEHYLSFWSGGEVYLALEEEGKDFMKYSWTTEEELKFPYKWSEEHHERNISDIMTGYTPFENMYIVSEIDSYSGNIEFYEIDEDKSLEVLW